MPSDDSCKIFLKNTRFQLQRSLKGVYFLKNSQILASKVLEVLKNVFPKNILKEIHIPCFESS